MKPKLTNADFARAAKRLRCVDAAIKAVAEVESLNNGFYPDGFPVILFERHIFRKFTQGRYNRSHPELSGPPGGYGKAGANQRRKFSAAFALNPEAAMKSCSWGKFQIMGFNHGICGYKDVGSFVDAMKESEGKHLDAFVEFVISNKLDRHLRNLDWAAFAKGYNGAGYKKNNYDVKMARAYRKYQQTSAADDPATPAPNSATNSDELSNNPALPTEAPLPKPETPPAGTTIEHTEYKSDSGESGQSTTVTQGTNVAVPKEEQVGFFRKIWKKALGMLTGIGGAEQLKANAESFSFLGLTADFMQKVVIVLLVVALIWIVYELVMHIVEWWGKRKRTDTLAQVNSTPTNQVVIIPRDQLEQYENDKGWIVIPR